MYRAQTEINMGSANRNGYSLSEVMAAVATVAVIAAIAYPSYLSQVKESRRVKAASEFTSLSQAQDSYFTRFRNYASVVQAPVGCSGAACGLGKASNLSTNDFYMFSAQGNASTYMLTATARGTEAEDTDCLTLTIDKNGVKRATNANGEDVTEKCW